MWIIFVFILVTGAGAMTYRAATGDRAGLAEPWAPRSHPASGEATSNRQIGPAVLPTAGANPAPQRAPPTIQALCQVLHVAAAPLPYRPPPRAARRASASADVAEQSCLLAHEAKM